MEECIEKNHKVEYFGDEHWITWYRCLDCKESHFIYRDTNGG